MLNTKNNSLLELRNITKVFPGVKALDNVSIKAESGEVMALLGENGAGKSTLMKILSGAYSRDSGEILIDGKELPKQYTPLEGRQNGVGIIYQELSLLEELTVAENIYLTHEPIKIKIGKIINYNKMYEEARNQLKKLKAEHIDVKEKVGNLPLPEKQMVEIAKALAVDCKVIIMDEPTTSLTWSETERLFDVIRSLKKNNFAIIYISHRLDEIFQIADSATIMRDGKVVGKLQIKDTTKEELISAMTGKQLHHRERVAANIVENENKKVLLELKNVADNKFIRNINLSLNENEVLGIGGLIGSKRTELLRMAFGADKLKGGEIFISGKKINVNSPQDAIKNGIGYLSENRKDDGLNLGLTIEENIVQTDMESISNSSFIKWEKVRKICEDYITKLNIKGKPTMQVENLSGGNQQKVAIAKWLHAGCKVLIFDEPTRGIDVAAKAEIYTMIKKFAQDGKGAIVISSEVNELVDVCDRVIIMSRGEITHEIKSNEITQDNILQCIITKGR